VFLLSLFLGLTCLHLSCLKSINPVPFIYLIRPLLQTYSWKIVYFSYRFVKGIHCLGFL
jgi:hypothetical protein